MPTISGLAMILRTKSATSTNAGRGSRSLRPNSSNRTIEAIIMRRQMDRHDQRQDVDAVLSVDAQHEGNAEQHRVGECGRHAADDAGRAVAAENPRRDQASCRPGDDHRREIGRPQPPWCRAVEIGVDHGAEQQQRHGDADGEFRKPVPDLRLEIAGPAGEIAERDEAEDEQNGFGERRHRAPDRRAPDERQSLPQFERQRSVAEIEPADAAAGRPLGADRYRMRLRGGSRRSEALSPLRRRSSARSRPSFAPRSRASTASRWSSASRNTSTSRRSPIRPTTRARW